MQPHDIFDPSPSIRIINSFVQTLTTDAIPVLLTTAPGSEERHVVRTCYASHLGSAEIRLKFYDGLGGTLIGDFNLPAITAGCFPIIGYMAGSAGTGIYALISGTVTGNVILTLGMEVHHGS